MKIKLLTIGKTSKAFLIQGEEEYAGRLKHYCTFERIELPDLKNAAGLSKAQLKQAEGKELLSRISPGDTLVLLDERGKEYSSIEFSTMLQEHMNRSVRTLVFVIGGAYGFSDEVYARANGKLSLSRMTFSHQMVRMIFLEQLYRAFTILRGEAYHHQ
ncbi:MAG: 23S rRNA (pseudouridine(1915)-N(3))-methyltransferase RlmH [Cryomorphaceae bacterium]|nr:23S rRNA (pseudouridine(1915)-N(3))-methyltransferase RlmH [Cryomorphaceae bacterium]